MARFFPNSLKGEAFNWFYKLTPRSLHNFEVVDAFIKKKKI